MYSFDLMQVMKLMRTNAGRRGTSLPVLEPLSCSASNDRDDKRRYVQSQHRLNTIKKAQTSLAHVD